MSFLKAPYFKGKNFNPMPVVRGGIPKYADSRLNKKVIGTPDWEKYWLEQLYYIHHGYQTGGLFLPGRFYYYLNFNQMSTVNGVINPDFVDLHLELAYLIEYAKKNHKNVIIAKKRRAGISEATQKMVVDYGWRFSFGYQAGVAAGQDVYAQDFMTKWRAGNKLMPPELFTNTLTNNDDEVVAGYKILNDLGQWQEGGTGNRIIVRTMYKDPNMFKGLFLNDVIAEEAGEFEKLKLFYGATKDCLTDGDIQRGTFFIYGTGGNINKGSRDFKEMWYEPESCNAIKFLITAGRFHKPFYGGCGSQTPQTPNLLKTHKTFEIIGVEDTVAAVESIKKKRDILLKTGDRKGYLDSLQNLPLEEKDIFRKTSVNNFDSEKLNEQEYAISTNPKKYSRFKLEWLRDENGLIKMPLQVSAVAAKPEDDATECFYILDAEHPRKGFSNLYVGGIDSYDQDIAKTSKSLGAMCVMIRANNIQGAYQKAPVAVICSRPKRKEIFYDMCLRLSVYYNLLGNVLVDVAKPQIIKYFEDRGALMYMAYRPKKFESEKTEQTHTFGISLNTYSRPMMVALMEAAIYYNGNQIWFNHVEELDNGSKIQCDLINQLSNFDEAEVGSDNDLADAYGIALVQDVSCELNPQDQKDVDEDELFNLHVGTFDRFGNYIPGESQRTLKSEEQDHDLFGLH